MNRNLKLCLMFAPLLVFFVGLFAVVQDARSPKIKEYACKVLAAGPAAHSMRETTERVDLYRHSENPLYEIALQCDTMPKTAFINDEQLLQTPVKHDQKASLRVKDYQLLPNRWILSVHTGESDMLVPRRQPDLEKTPTREPNLSQPNE